MPQSHASHGTCIEWPRPRFGAVAHRTINRSDSASRILLKADTQMLRSFNRTALDIAGRALWHLPVPFAIARILGVQWPLRCVVFHDISDAETPFTQGLNGTISRKGFESALSFITEHYNPVSLPQVVQESSSTSLPPRPILITFDDTYASAREFAIPLCFSKGVPTVFFVNGSCLDNRQLAIDNLICYVANTRGLDTIRAAAVLVGNGKAPHISSVTDVFAQFLPSTSLRARDMFREFLLKMAGIDNCELASEAKLYLRSSQLRDLAALNCEIGDHTYSHVNCRVLNEIEMESEIDRNRSLLEGVSGARVRSFSIPYGSSADVSEELLAHLRRSGYEALFMSQSRVNRPGADRFHLDRVSIRRTRDAALFSEIEVLPRLRGLRSLIPTT